MNVYDRTGLSMENTDMNKTKISAAVELVFQLGKIDNKQAVISITERNEAR